MTTKRPAGGAATASGMNFQYCATAWVAVWVLAEKEVSPPWGLPVGTTLEWLRCETEHPVDDLLVGTSEDELVFSQIKHTLHLSTATDSALASAFDQFVRQFVAHWERPLDPVRDRLVLITGPSSSVPLRVHLPTVLGRLRQLAHGQSLDDAAVNQEERRALAVIVGHIKRSWQAALGVSPSDDEARQCLSLIRVHVLDVDEGGTAAQEAKDRLRATVLRNPEQAETAWALLIASCAAFAAGRSGTDRLGFQRLLLDAGIDIQASRSYRDDIERLRTYSRTTADFLAHIRVGTTKIKIQRHSTEELRHVAEEGSLLVVGEPGAGKSGALHDLVQVLEDEERDQVFLAVDHLAASSLGALRAELGLDFDLIESHFCCRICVFEKVCTKAQAFHLPCQRPEVSKAASSLELDALPRRTYRRRRLK